ncbi:MAG: YeaC family protein [Colwellia sp.]|nr:YeaC family protein [Colwellia sp.]MCW8866230.1 YeaC family protein [Colwellia sp.]MCW9081600.1 YeaC family protein [Colwellia sp.]
MNLENTIENMPEAMYLRLKCAAETGKWPEGTVVDKAQRDTALQLIMAYQARHLNSDEMLSIGSDGKIVNKNKRQLKAEFSTAAKDEPITPCVKPDIAHFTEL